MVPYSTDERETSKFFFSWNDESRNLLAKQVGSWPRDLKGMIDYLREVKMKDSARFRSTTLSINRTEQKGVGEKRDVKDITCFGYNLKGHCQ